MNKFKKGDKISIKERFKEMQDLMKPFISKYEEPVLVHATSSQKLFKKILKEEKLMVPKFKDASIEHSYVERMLGIYPCVFLSLGFAYASSYDFKYSFIFNLDYLKSSDFYRNSVSYQAYKAVIKYWYENSPEYIDKLAAKNKTCREVVNKFYNDRYNGEKRVLFDFWKCEKETFELIQSYPKKAKLIKIIKKIVKEKYASYPESKRIVMDTYTEDAVPEIIVKHDIKLKDNPSFLGFYIRGKAPKDIMNSLRKNYKGKIIFNGKRIEVIK